VGAFHNADLATLREPEPHDKVPADQQLDIRRVVSDLNASGVQADASPDVAELVRRVAEGAEPNDLVLVMSNGSFGGFIASLLDALKKRFGA
jgi:UDP-N-acetylmuramate: L-alanyl-gamma-D-glutamyl-meso-diaminopimelate ligase